MSARRAHAAGALGLLLSAVLTTACGLLPDSGPVHRQDAPQDVTGADQTYFYPPGPGRNAGRIAIAKGFLVAMEANPLNTAAARAFLSEHAGSSWTPSGGTIVYDGSSVTQKGATTLMRLSGAHRVDAAGVWQRGPAHRITVHLKMTREHGEWRIENPSSALVVKSSYFQARFAAYQLYFFDRGNRVLVPETVYAPDGQLTASTLVRGLLVGPEPRLATVAHSALPTGTTLDPSVVVTDRGVAEVPLSADILKLSPSERSQALVELAWTLQQVPGIQQVRVTVDGSPLTLSDGRTEVGADDGAEFAPTGLGPTRDLIGIRNGRVVTISGRTASPVAGAFGKRGLLLRSLALERSGRRIVGVAQNGTIAFTGASVDQARVRRMFTGTDLLRPRIDGSGTVWLVDRTSQGAVVHAIRHGHARVVRLPGISGQPVNSFAISPDGTRFAAGIDSGIRPRVVVDVLRRTAAGSPTRGSGSISLPITSYDPSHKLGPVVDLGWRTPTMLAVLTRPTDGTSRVVYAVDDGSPGNLTDTEPDAFQGKAVDLVVNPDNDTPLMLVDASGRLERLDTAGKWEAAGVTGLIAATYAD